MMVPVFAGAIPSMSGGLGIFLVAVGGRTWHLPAAMKHNAEKITKEREEAWIGDAVLALHVREKILNEDKKLDGEKFVRFTSNEFLSAKGNPTSVEAEIGRIYESEGLVAAREWIEKELLPLFIAKEKHRAKVLRTQGTKRKR